MTEMKSSFASGIDPGSVFELVAMAFDSNMKPGGALYTEDIQRSERWTGPGA